MNYIAANNNRNSVTFPTTSEPSVNNRKDIDKPMTREELSTTIQLSPTSPRQPRRPKPQRFQGKTYFFL